VIAATPAAKSASVPRQLQGFEYLKMAPPAYPKEAIDKKIEGRLVLRVLIDEEGVPKSVEVERSEPADAASFFAQSAKDAIMTWRFKPELENGKPHAAYAQVPIDYSLHNDS